MASSLSCFQLSKFGEHNIFVHGVHVLWNSRDLKLIMPKKTKKNISVKLALYVIATFTCSRLTVETLEKGVKYIPS